jgi:hypothetical protein
MSDREIDTPAPAPKNIFRVWGRPRWSAMDALARLMHENEREREQHKRHEQREIVYTRKGCLAA